MGVPPMYIGGTPMPQGLTGKMSVSLLIRPLERTDLSESVQDRGYGGQARMAVP